MDTEKIAILGAVTGIIGTITGCINLYFRYKQHQKDSRKLSCKLSMNIKEYEQEFIINHELEIVSVGKRNVELDKYTVYFKPKKFFQRFNKRKLWNKNKFCNSTDIQYSTLKDGGKLTLLFLIRPEHYSLIEKIYVFDKTGEKWKVKLIPKNIYSKRVKNQFFDKKEIKEGDKKVTIKTYHMDREYILNALCVTTTNIGDKRTVTYPIIKRFDDLKSLENYKSKFLKKCENDYLTGKIGVVELANI